jgi:error-prone DNA polymerase
LKSLPAYAELHCKTNYSFLSGASHADELVDRAIQLGYHALAITDESSLAGVVRAYAAARDTDLKLIIGAELQPVDAPPLVVWATDRKSYGNLCRLLTIGRGRASKGNCELAWQDIQSLSDGLIAGFIPVMTETEQGSSSEKRSSIERGEPNALASGLKNPSHQNPSLQNPSMQNPRPQNPGMQNPRLAPTAHGQQEWNRLVDPLHRFRACFGDRAYLLAELHCGKDDQQKLQRLISLSQQTHVPIVAAGDVHYHAPARLPLHDVLTAIKYGTTVAQANELLLTNAQRHLQSLQQRASAFAALPAALARTIEIADRCQFELSELRYEYPEELAPDGMTPAEYLAQLTWQGAQQRYPRGIPPSVRELIEHELQLIGEMHYEAYFLTVWDLVRYARSREILCQGRGSAANSAVCYCLEVTAVDPATTDVLFERFISRERNEAPDIDVDFEHERREEVLQYLYTKYGRDRAGLAATVITYRSRSAIRDVGKALGLSLDRVDALAKNVNGYTHEPKLDERCRDAGIDPESRVGQQLIYLVNEIIGFPRHLSQHVGGMVMTRGALCELVPIENAAMADRTVIQWDKDDLEELGILKVDCLCLGMLTAIRKCFAMINAHYDRGLTLANIPQDDSDVYDMICAADTIGVFQIESRAQMSMLPRLRPRCYYDLVIEVSIVRPGPIQGNMVHPYLRRRQGEEVPIYPNDEIRRVLHKTLGVPIFQEQAMRLAVVAAGFTPGEADQLRRAMGAWRKSGVIEKFRQKLLDGMNKRGLSEEFAHQVFNQIRGFGEYGFPESHAASFALLVYVSAWLKHHYPAVFCAGILNSQPMGFYAPAQLIRCAKEHGVQILPVDVNFSDWDCTLERSGDGSPVDDQPSFISDCREPLRFALRLGMRMIGGLSERSALAICEARTAGDFGSMSEFTRRTGLNRSVIEQLSEADAFGSLERDRRNALWEALSQEKKRLDQPLFDALAADDEPLSMLPEITDQEQVYEDYRTLGLSLRSHPLAFQRASLKQLQITPIAELQQTPANRHVRVAGLVLMRQRPSTAKGVTFVTIEDETGAANLVLFQNIWDRYYKIAKQSGAWIAHGKLEKKDGVTHVIVNRIEDMSQSIGELKTKSRNFR